MQTITNNFWRWLDRVAEALIAIVARVVTPRAVQLVEGERGQFAIVTSDNSQTAGLAGVELHLNGGTVIDQPPPQVAAALQGSRVELILRPDRFVFKPLDLPVRAAEFLDGVVRSQIDRLTPWSAEHAAFGFSAPVDTGSGRIVVTVAATAQMMLAPVLQAFAGCGAHTIKMSARTPGSPPTAPAITIMEENVAGILGMRMARRILLIVLTSCVLLAAATAIAAGVINSKLEARQDELAGRIAVQRAAGLKARSAPDDPMTAAQRALAQRKNDSASAVIALDVLSRILPDHTYVTELRIEADKLRLIGITHDAPGLIRLIEQTAQFTQATFFAPTTRSQSDTGDRFNIEARMKPVFEPVP